PSRQPPDDTGSGPVGKGSVTKSSSSPRAIRLLLVGLSSTLVFACAPDGGGDAAAPANRADTGVRDAQATSVGVPDAADKPMVSEAGGDAPLDHAGRDGGADSGASSDSGPPPSM